MPSLTLLGLHIQSPDNLQANSRLPGLGKLPRLRTSVHLLLRDVEAPLLGCSQEVGLAPRPGAHILKGLNTLWALEAAPWRCQTESHSLLGEAAPGASWTSRGTCLPSRFRSLFPNAFTRASLGGRVVPSLRDQVQSQGMGHVQDRFRICRQQQQSMKPSPGCF